MQSNGLAVRFRKSLKFVIPLLFCAFFWKPLSLTGIGAIAKLYFHVQKGWSFEYSSLKWTDQGLHFNDLTLIDEENFSFKAPSVIAFIGKKHLEIQRPHLMIFKIPKYSSGDDFNWTLSLQDGILEGEGIERAHFSFEKTASDSLGRCAIDWEESKVVIDAKFVENKIVLEAELTHLNPIYLRKWLGDQLSGFLQGKIHLVSEGNLWKKCWGQLEGKHLSFSDIWTDVDLAIDWDGSLEKLSSLREGRVRILVNNGILNLGSSLLQNIQGEFSYLGESGMKWEINSSLNHQNLSMSGRSFFHSLQDRWIESEIQYNETVLRLSCCDFNEGRNWETRYECVKPDIAQLIQDAIRRIDPSWSEWSLAKGRASGSLKILESQGNILSWEIPHFHGEDLLLQNHSFALECKEMILDEGDAYSLCEGMFSYLLPNQKKIIGSNWMGSGKAKKGVFTGNIEGFETSFEFEGGLDGFVGHATAKGLWEGEFSFGGDWDGSILHLLVHDANVEGFHFSGSGDIDKNLLFSWQSNRFFGPCDPILKILKKDSAFKGQIESIGNGFFAQGGVDFLDWSVQARIREGEMPLFSSARLENLEMEIGADSNGVCIQGAKGIFSWEKKFPFYCPIFESKGIFDIRLYGETWDFLRLAGQSQDGFVSIDQNKSHLLGAPLSVGNALISDGSLKSLQLQFDLPWESLSSLIKIPSQFSKAPIQGKVSCCVNYDSKAVIEVTGVDLKWENRLIDLQCRLCQDKKHWRLETSKIGDFSIEGLFSLDENALRMTQGKGKWRDGLELEWVGRFDSFHKWGVNLSYVRINLSEISPLTSYFGWPLEKIEGVLEGTGVLSWEGKLEADFDFAASHLKAGTIVLENRTPLHLYYSSDQGILFRGLDLNILKPDLDMPWIGCKIGLLQYDVVNALWILSQSHFRLPADFLTAFQKRPSFLEGISLNQELNFIADVECSSDFSTLSCSMQEGFIPFKGEIQHIQNLHLSWDPHFCAANFNLFHQENWVNIALAVNLEPKISGRLIIQKELMIDWTYEDQFAVQTIEGTFAGVEAAFHSEGESLIGSARIDFKALSEMIPPRIAQVFYDLKMGKGYELMGRLSIHKKGVSFKGILSGKQLELFDYQLRTLLAQVEIEPDLVRIYDVKISDSAGVMKIDEIVAKEPDGGLWTLSIPHLTILELRPSLIQRLGKEQGPITPLVVRELKIEDFKGMLEDSKTYTAKGELHFINSYKRENTVFEIPSNVLSRIVGLDLDLLIPVCGTLSYELKDGFFHLTELSGAYSENKRSEFFLVQTEDSPRMDLDGNLNILIKMKQFVLFKLTEAFLISIDGKLDDPEFHLQKKRHFLGL